MQWKLDNAKKFLLKLVITGILVFLVRAVFQAPTEWFHITMLTDRAAAVELNKQNALKVMLLVGIVFYLFLKDRIAKIHHTKNNRLHSSFLFILGVGFVALVYVLRYITNYYHIAGPLQVSVISLLKLISLGASFALILTAVFTFTYLKSLYRHMKREIAIAGAAAMILYFLLNLFESQWYFFSSIVAYILNFLLSLLYPVQYYVMEGNPIISIGGFTVSIGSPCSGIDSMFLFTAFFSAIYALDHRRIKKNIYALLFTLGFIGVFFVNILRLFLLILIGVEYSPEFAVGLFHTNAGWILFVLYFLGYYALIRRHIYVR